MDIGLRDEIARNFDHFQRTLATFLVAQHERFALLKSGSVVEFFDSAGAADEAGTSRFPDQIYSIQQVTTEPVALGLYANAPD